MKTKLFPLGVLLALSLSAHGALYTFDGPFNNNGGAGDGVIPDNSFVGLSDAHTLSGLPNSITTVMLRFTLAEGLGADLNGYLRLGNLVSSPAYDLTAYLGTLGAIPVTPTEYSVDVSSSFSELSPNNTWTLFFADPNPGGETTLHGWSLEIAAVPEPTTWALAIFGGVLGLWRVRRGRKQKA